MKRYFIAIITFLAAAIPLAVFAQAPPPAPVNDPGEPYISISPDYFYPLEEILYLEGRANPNAIVTVNLTKPQEKPVKFTVKTDSSGEWVVAEKTYLTSGNWEVRARQQVGTVLSSWSNPRVIRSVVTGISLFGLQIRYVVIAGVIFVFLAIIAGIFIYFKRKIRRLKRGLLERQIKDTEERFHRGFAEIRQDLMNQLKEIALNSQNRPLTAEEIDRRDKVLRELEEMEKNLEHDVGDIRRRY